MIYQKHKQWFYNCQKLAQKHDSMGRYGLVAIAVKGSRILSIGYNSYPSKKSGGSLHKLYTGFGVHAELDLLSSNECANSVVYIAGYTNKGTEICSKPCGRCSTLLLNSQVKSIVFLNTQGILEILPRENLNITIRNWR